MGAFAFRLTPEEEAADHAAPMSNDLWEACRVASCRRSSVPPPCLRWLLVLCALSSAVVLTPAYAQGAARKSGPPDHVKRDDAVPCTENAARLRAPPGFQVKAYYNGVVPKARSLALSEASANSKGPIITYVGTLMYGAVYALVDVNRDGVAETALRLPVGLAVPSGVAWRRGSLYVSGYKDLAGGVWRFDNIDSSVLSGKANLSRPVTITTSLPRFGDMHDRIPLRFGPDGLLYLSAGAPCNICDPGMFRGPDGRMLPRASILSLNLTSGAIAVVASGVRNSVGFDWNPLAPSQLWFTDNGRDLMGNNQPDDELNMLTWAGGFYGYPYCHTLGKGEPKRRSPGILATTPDPNVNKGNTVFNCSGVGTYPAQQALGPHVAPLGMRFYQSTSRSPPAFPAPYNTNRSIFIAEHGSWNRDVKIGYRVSVVQLGKDGRVAQHAPFITGFLTNEGRQDATSWGRPVDLLQLPDGSLLVSDDEGGAIFRVASTLQQ